jgi:hypothetical protein
LYGSAKRKLKKAMDSKGSTGGLQQPGYAALLKFRNALTRVPIRSMSGGSNQIKEVNPPKRPRDSTRPWTYREALTDETETASHILCDCEALAELIFCHLGTYLKKPGDYCEILLCKILYFVGGMGQLAE